MPVHRSNPINHKILTLHPEGKAGVNISQVKYEQVRTAILSAIQEFGEITFKELPGEVKRRLPGFDGSITWYTTTVKLDLEARGEIKRINGAKPQRLRLADSFTGF